MNMDFLVKIRRITSGVFGLAAILFLLPILTISCDSQKIITLSGKDLLMGIDVDTIREMDKKTFIDLEKLLMGKTDNPDKVYGFEVKEESKLTNDKQSDRSPSNRYAIILVVACLLGVGIYFIKDLTTSQYIGTFLSIVVIVAVLLIPQQFSQTVSSVYMENAVKVKREVGFYVVLLLACSNLVINLFALFRDQFVDDVVEMV